MSLKLIGIGHSSRVGKDSVARELALCAQQDGIKTQVISLAWLLKETAHTVFQHYGLQRGEVYERGGLFEEVRAKALPIIGLSPVDLWIALGNKVREIYPLTWVDGVYAIAAQYEAELLIIPDVRFPNEAGSVRAGGGVLLRVRRPNQIAHKSDKHLVSYAWDYDIENVGTLPELEAKARHLWEMELRGRWLWSKEIVE